MNRPLSNGSSGTTIEILFLLTLVGANALTLLGLRGRAGKPSSDDRSKREAR